MNTNIKNKSLTAISNKATEILGDAAAKRAEILQAITEAENAAQAAEKTKETTLNENEFAAAEKALTEAQSRAAFNRQLLDHMDGTARMSEADYNKAVDTCKDIVFTARDDARAKVKKAMQDIKNALEAYTETANEATATLEQLDAAANVLQTKHPDRISRYTTDKPGVYREVRTKDPNEWKKHTTRFNAGGSFMNGDGTPEELSIYASAWQAVKGIWPDQQRKYF